MTGRARARSRGRARGQETGPPGVTPSQEAPREVSPSEVELVGRGRTRSVPGVVSSEAVIQISAGFQQVKIGERGGRRRDFHDEGINTRQAMEHVKDSKTGISGSPIDLKANFFKILSRPQWVLYQYHVDFKPVMESRRLRSALLFQHEETLGKARTFDGAILFLPHRLHNSVQFNGGHFLFWLMCETRMGEKVQITVTLTNELPPTSPVCLQFYNIIFRRVLRMLNMQQIGRHYYNPTDPLNIPQHRLTIWPGFTTTILQYESSIMLCTDVSHKVLRSETVLSFMYNNKTYRIDDIAWDYTPNNTFKRGDSEISFKDYYKTQYSLDISDDHQVLLVSNVKKAGPSGRPPPGPALLVPEFCYLTGAIAELTTWGLNFDNKLLSLKGRVLPAERILQGPTTYEYNPWQADWSKEMRGIPLISCRPLENWIMLFTPRNVDVAQALLQTLNRVSKPLGIPMQKARMLQYEDRQESLLKALQQNVNPATQMVVVVLPSNRKDKYDSVKKYLCVDCPTPSQCVVARTLSRQQALMTVATKIALQMNCKMGGELWSVDIPLKQLMIVGIDCYHDTAAGKRSIGALVASLNHGMSRWFSKCVLQSRGQEIMDGLKGALQGALKAWLKHNKCLPSRIIVYRDGVGDGMLQSVVNYEVPQIMGCIKSMEQKYEPKLTVVVVKKRISSRFFARIDGKLTNPPPGTCIDTEVTRPEWYDFFIVSQAVRMGSVSPTHYNVVYDSSGLKPDHMQRLTYKLCHMYYNWQGIIRVPAPCQYAHKLAFLVGQSIHREPNTNLDDFLYYL
uniref:Piwi-like protein 1 n=1 Tax=Esox lucius TaxID=8010 RepID=A0A6Q2XKA3_ESOLU